MNTCSTCSSWGQDKRRKYYQVCDVLSDETKTPLEVITFCPDDSEVESEVYVVLTPSDFGCPLHTKVKK